MAKGKKELEEAYHSIRSHKDTGYLKDTNNKHMHDIPSMGKVLKDTDSHYKNRNKYHAFLKN